MGHLLIVFRMWATPAKFLSSTTSAPLSARGLVHVRGNYDSLVWHVHHRGGVAVAGAEIVQLDDFFAYADLLEGVECLVHLVRHVSQLWNEVRLPLPGRVQVEDRLAVAMANHGGVRGHTPVPPTWS